MGEQRRQNADREEQGDEKGQADEDQAAPPRQFVAYPSQSRSQDGRMDKTESESYSYSYQNPYYAPHAYYQPQHIHPSAAADPRAELEELTRMTQWKIEYY